MEHNDLLKRLRLEREERMRAAGIQSGLPAVEKKVGERDRRASHEGGDAPHGKNGGGGGGSGGGVVGGASTKKGTTVDLTLSDDNDDDDDDEGDGENHGGGNGNDVKILGDLRGSDGAHDSRERGRGEWDDELAVEIDDYDLAMKLQEEEEQLLLAGEHSHQGGSTFGGAAPSHEKGSGTPWESGEYGSDAGAIGSTGGGSLLGGQALSSQDLTGSVCPDSHQMFLYFDSLYFKNALTERAVFVEWSKKMTLCAGLCSYRGGSAECRIALSEPLLKFRSPKEVKETLLHEMIHAWQFVTSGNRDREDHGAIFKSKMSEINAGKVPDMYRPEEGYAISVYHSFNDEVDHYRVHWWRCVGCALLIKRSMNREPSEKDCREYRKDRSKMRPCTDNRCPWHSHAKRCGGKFEKIKSPDPKPKPPPKGKKAHPGGKAKKEGGFKATERAVNSRGTLDGPVKAPKQPGIQDFFDGPVKAPKQPGIQDFFAGGGGSKSTKGGQGVNEGGAASFTPAKRLANDMDAGGGGMQKYTCPVCAQTFESEGAVSVHLDSCLAG